MWTASDGTYLYCGDEVTFSVEFAIENVKPIKNKLSTDAIISCRQQASLLADKK